MRRKAARANSGRHRGKVTSALPDWLTSSQLLLKHFGLEAYFATTRRALGDSTPWPKHKNHRWHYPAEELQTTTCYLILPRQSSEEREYAASDMEVECGGALVRGAIASFVTPPVLDNKEKRVKQFQRALRMLKLQPYAHSSQLNDTVSAQADDNADNETSESEEEGDTVESEGNEKSKVYIVPPCALPNV